MARFVILGNSGSGKSTLARWLSGRTGVPRLDLDTVYWEPGPVAVPRSPEAARELVEQFCRTHAGWVVEGCYGSLARTALVHQPRLIFLDPGVEVCRSHCRSRPWEPHKYASLEEQDARLQMLLDWVAAYPVRDGEMGLRDHWACFREYSGPKVHLSSVPVLEPPSAQIFDWLP